MLAVLIGLWTTAQIHRSAVAAFIGASTIMTDFAVTAAGAGMLAGAYFPAYGLMQLPSGIMADILRPRRILLVGGTLFALSGLAFAIAPTFELAVGARVAMGVTSGVLWLSSLKVCAGLPDIAYPRAVSFLVSLGSIGTVAALAGLPVLVALIDWRSGTLALTLPIVLAAAALLVVRVAEPDDAALAPNHRARIAESLRGLSVVLRQRQYWRIFIPGMMWNGGQFALISWLPRYARDALGMPPIAVGILPALLPAGLMIGSWTIGWLNARYPGLAMRPFYVNIVLWTIGLAILTSGALESNGAALYPLALGMGIVYGAWYMGLARTGQLAGPRLLGTATGIANGLGFFPGFIYPWLMGVAMDAIDRPTGGAWTYSGDAFRAGFGIVLAGSLASFVALALLAERRRPAAG